AKQSEVVAIGEVGLDSYRIEKSEIRSTKSETILLEQERVLGEFIKIAQQVSKPMILHCRGSKKPGERLQTTDYGLQLDPHERLIEILGAIPEKSRPRFVVHCYQGTTDQAQRYLALGGLISFTGTITYSDDPAVTEVVRSIPRDRLMVETDSPYLSPVPYRGEPNEPWKVIEVARRIAELTDTSVADVAAQTTATARQFFNFPLGTVAK
ncbi:TatD family hydrolase, partial [Candidatus Berkelbacteria bacterium]|nr:TatD family hydrolase [Candidatus Berkelbacteria bacterium]